MGKTDHSWLGVGKLASIGVLVSGTLIGLAIFVLITRSLKMEEYTMAMAMIGKKTSGSKKKRRVRI